MHETVKNALSGAFCGSGSRRPEFSETVTSQGKVWSVWRTVQCLGCKRSRVQISAARPAKTFRDLQRELYANTGGTTPIPSQLTTARRNRGGAVGIVCGCGAFWGAGSIVVI